MKKHTLKEFIPLIVIFSTITLLTILTSTYLTLDGNGIMRVFMGIFMTTFALFKVSNLKMFAEAYSKYDIVAMAYKPYGLLYPFIELSLGLLYLANIAPLATNIITFIVMLISSLGVYLKLRKREQIVCACLGAVFKLPMTWVTLVEDLLMAAMAGWMIVQITVV